MDSSRQLHIGCGGQHRPGCLNVDIEPTAAADVCADAAALPFSAEHFDRVEMIHVLEHLGYRGALHAVSEAFRVLRPNGELVIESPHLEATFRLFLKDRSALRRGQLLSWLYGLQAKGYEHRLVFPEVLLRITLELAGFGSVRREPQLYHRYAPGLRIVARRRGLPVHRVLADLRAWLWGSDSIDLSHQLDVLEFELVFVDTVLALGGAGTSPDNPVEAALAAILMAPSAARQWLSLSLRSGVAQLVDYARLLDVAAAAVEEQVPARMEAAFGELCDRGTRMPDGYLALRSRGLRALRSALGRTVVGKEKSAQARLLPAPIAFAGKQPPLTRAVIERRVAELHDRGVRLLCRGRTQQAMRVLQRAARCRVSPLFPLWNLAIIEARLGHLRRAELLYGQALELAYAEARQMLLRELAVCLLHAGRPGRALRLARELPLGAERDELIRIARQLSARSAGRLKTELPPLRTLPVLSGEGLHHAPVPA